MIVPTLRVGMPPGTLRVLLERDAERHWMHSHAERGNDHMAKPAELSQMRELVDYWVAQRQQRPEHSTLSG